MPYLLRLDDASEYMDIEKWHMLELLLNRYSIKPIVGVIPQNKDKDLTARFPFNPNFWGLCDVWLKNGWTLAMHGSTHEYSTSEGGLNPVNQYSEFAGVAYDIQERKIQKGLEILQNHGIFPKIFFAPAHTFDENTLLALENNSNIRIISDTIAMDVYKEKEFFFIPQQSGKARKLPFRIVTFCYHPNNMTRKSFAHLEEFFSKNARNFIRFEDISFRERKLNFIDYFLRRMYFLRK